MVRLGNIDLEAPNTPSLDAPNPYAPKMPPAGMGMLPAMPGMPMAPPGMAGPGFGPGIEVEADEGRNHGQRGALLFFPHRGVEKFIEVRAERAIKRTQ